MSYTILSMTILIVEDQLDLAELVEEYLSLKGFECDLAYDGAMAWRLIQQNAYDLVILDINLPKLSGYHVCTQMREHNFNTPVLMLTAKDALDDKLKGFEVGTDDYLIKPFAMEELLMRCNSLIRRANPTLSVVKVSDLEIDMQAKRAKRGSRLLDLSPTEWSLLLFLARHQGKVISKIDIEEHLWPMQEVNKNMLKTQIYRLRQALAPNGEEELIHSLRGQGIILEARKEN